MTNILEQKTNFLIIKEYNLIKLYSYKSLVSVYDTETKSFEEVPYTFINVFGNSCSHSSTTSKHINKFKQFINANLKGAKHE